MDEVVQTVAQLRAESEDLDELVAELSEECWRRSTPAKGWTIAHQIGHLLWTDEVALQAVTDEVTFAHVAAMAAGDSRATIEAGASRNAALSSEELLRRWRAARNALEDALANVERKGKVPWFGPSMTSRSMATARLMETWAHGQDVADALGVSRTPTGRLRDIAHLGVRTRDFAYTINGHAVPLDEFRVELDAPDGSLWTWGPEEANDHIAGPALDFCLVVTQRRDPCDVDLHVVGDEAARWLTFAQAFAGPPRHAIERPRP